ncbi:MAG: S1C family serine protease [Planctomycetes bacterium]|nr:S1C family serine protease [Planctomycetota bacterium]
MDKAQFDLTSAQMHMSPDPEDLTALGIPAEAIAKLMGDPSQGTRLARQYDRTSLQTLALVAPALDAAGNCVVEIFSEDKPILLGTIVGADGWIVTKASDLGEKLTVVLPDGNSLEAKVIGKDQATDLALLKVEAQGLSAAQFSNDSPLGGWLASPVRDPNSPAVGVVSIAARPIPKEFAHFFGNTRVILGLATAPDSCTVEIVSPGMPAEKAGLEVGDVVLAINGKPFTDPGALVARVKQANPGETLTLKIRRGGKVLELKPVLGEAKTVDETQHGIGEEDGIAAGKLSQRRTDFPLAIQHDAAVWAEECGGPLINLQGKTVGINIARYDQVCAFAIPAELVEKTIAKLREKAHDNIDVKHSQPAK